MALTLNRNIHKAYNRVRDQNFSLDGLMGFNIKDKTVGVIGTGAIGAGFARIIKAFDCRVLAYDVHRNEELRSVVEYVSLPELYSQSDLISLHAPLTKETEHMINDEAIQQMKGQQSSVYLTGEGRVMLINTSRGGLIDSRALIRGLKSQRIGSVALDVYENEADLFFKDHSGDTIHDDVFSRLSSFPNVLITGHQVTTLHQPSDRNRHFSQKRPCRALPKPHSPISTIFMLAETPMNSHNISVNIDNCCIERITHKLKTFN